MADVVQRKRVRRSLPFPRRCASRFAICHVGTTKPSDAFRKIVFQRLSLFDESIVYSLLSAGLRFSWFDSRVGGRP